MKNVFLNQRNIILLFVSCFFVLLAQSCKKDKKDIKLIVTPKFDFKETFENRDSAYKTWIRYGDRTEITNRTVSSTQTNKSKVLLIYELNCYGVSTCLSDTGSALRNFTNFEGEKAFSLKYECNDSNTGYLAQIRNGKFLKIARFNTNTDETDWYKINISDTFSLFKTDTLQIRFGYSFHSRMSGPSTAYFDNIELREQ